MKKISNLKNNAIEAKLLSGLYGGKQIIPAGSHGSYSWTEGESTSVYDLVSKRNISHDYTGRVYYDGAQINSAFNGDFGSSCEGEISAEAIRVMEL